jgi:nanoRNase/pAp phosphatase (c-di-AMP/oligoRNAs hydrolase)
MDEPPQAPAFDLAAALDRLKGRKSLLIYTHDNPDPDALAAALGLQRLAEHELGVKVTLAHGGIVGRAQNRAMVDNLKVPLTPVEQIDPDSFDTIALVDSQPETGNNSLPPQHRIDIVIDHHPPRSGSARAAWCDIRPDLGATSTIVFEYLQARSVPVDTVLATAFFFALRTETRDLGRESSDAERRAYLALVPLVDHGLIYRMSHPKVPRAHFAALDRALRSALVYGDLVAVNLGVLGYPDLVAEIADLLLSYDDARFVLCLGRYGDHAYLSLRTEADNARAGTVMRAVVAHDGAAGGHGTMAGARLFAEITSEQDLQATFDEMVKRLLELLGRPPSEGDPLLRLQPARSGKTWSGRPIGGDS